MNFEVLINAAAFTNVDLSEKEKERAFRVNADAPGVLAEFAGKRGQADSFQHRLRL